ncbi:FtsX-like permease family protein, partial [Clostridioides difficile]|uniref:FtsX-like permease family protein n=1 Tax=Clostridioides difficile TaxID=1496 RepID=UPI003F8D1548
MKLFAKYFCKSALSMKSNIIILFLLSLLSSFMYFFVQISIDGNLEYLNSKPVLTNVEKEFLVSLQSNQTLAITFLVMLTLITVFVYFMFYKKYCSLHQKELGCYIALGYSTKKMALIILLISIILNFIANICGFFLGWTGSDVMLG